MSAVETRLCGPTSQIQRIVIALNAPPAGSSGPVERQLVVAAQGETDRTSDAPCSSRRQPHSRLDTVGLKSVA